MEKSTVVLIPCADYDKERVYRSIKAGVDAVGGIGAFVKPSERILVKPNFLYPSDADRCVTTHPAVISAVCRLLREAGMGPVSVGDSPANGNCAGAVKKLSLDEADLFGASVAEMTDEVTVDYPEGRACKRFRFAREVTEADAIIGLCKMKTHMLEHITGAVKNMYGLIAGYRKAVGHTRYSTPVSFARMLTDIHRATPQRLHIMDGITAMEGNGPASGNPVHMGILLVSADPVALDSVFARLIYLDPTLVPTNVQGALDGIGFYLEKDIRLLVAENGEIRETQLPEAVSRFGKPDFDVVRGRGMHTLLGLWGRLTGGERKPVIDAEKCIRCGLCVEHCPVDGKAIAFDNGRDKPPVYRYKKCIRCYCCQELCPGHAIRVK